MNWLKRWWEQHVQKTLASLLILLDGVNVAALEFYHQDIVRLVGVNHGESVFSGLRMLLAAVIGVRALRRKQSPLGAPVDAAVVKP